MHRKGNLHQLGMAFEFQTKGSKAQIIMSTLLILAAHGYTRYEMYSSLGAGVAIIPGQTVPIHPQKRWPFARSEKPGRQSDSLFDSKQAFNTSQCFGIISTVTPTRNIKTHCN